MTSALYPARIWKKDKVYYAQFLDLENGFTYADTLEEAKEMAADVLSTLLSSYIKHGEPIPLHSEAKGKNIYMIAPIISANRNSLYSFSNFLRKTEFFISLSNVDNCLLVIIFTCFYAN